MGLSGEMGIYWKTKEIIFWMEKGGIIYEPKGPASRGEFQQSGGRVQTNPFLGADKGGLKAAWEKNRRKRKIIGRT